MSKLNKKIDTIVHNSIVYGIDVHDSFKDTELDDQSVNVVTNSAITTELKKYLKKEEQIQPQGDWEDSDGTKFVYSEKPVDGGSMSKIIPNIKSLLTQIGGKLKIKWWLWGDNGEGSVIGEEVPTASSLSDGAMSKEDKTKLDNLALTGSLSDLKTEVKTNLVSSINEVFDVASKIRDASLSFPNYSEAFSHLLNEETTDLYVGGNIFIETINVPDLWISKKYDNWSSYTYINDATVIAQLKSGPIRVGYYDVSSLETQKIDLSDYKVKDVSNDFVLGTGENNNGKLYKKGGYWVVDNYSDLVSIDSQFLTNGCKASVASTNNKYTYNSETEIWTLDQLQEGSTGVSVYLDAGRIFGVGGCLNVGKTLFNTSEVSAYADSIKIESPARTFISVGTNGMSDSCIDIGTGNISIWSSPSLGSGVVTIGTSSMTSNLSGDHIVIGTDGFYTQDVCILGSDINIGTGPTDRVTVFSRDNARLNVGSNSIKIGSTTGIEISAKRGSISLIGTAYYNDNDISSVAIGSTINITSDSSSMTFSCLGLDLVSRDSQVPVCTSSVAGIILPSMYERYEAGTHFNYIPSGSSTISVSKNISGLTNSEKAQVETIVDCTSPRDYMYSNVPLNGGVDSRTFGSIDKLFSLKSHYPMQTSFIFTNLAHISNFDCSEAVSMYSTFNSSQITSIDCVLNSIRCKRFGLIFAGCRNLHKLDGIDLSAIDSDSVSYPSNWYTETSNPSSLPQDLKLSTNLHPLLCAFLDMTYLTSFPVLRGLNISLDETTYFNNLTITPAAAPFIQFLHNLGEAKYRLYENPSWTGRKGVIQFNNSVFTSINTLASSTADVAQNLLHVFKYKNWVISNSDRSSFYIPTES